MTELITAATLIGRPGGHAEKSSCNHGTAVRKLTTYLAELRLEIDFQGLQLASQFGNLVVARLHLLPACNNLPIHLLNLKTAKAEERASEKICVNWTCFYRSRIQ